ncbi:hypothetical protein ACFV2S_05885 [Streptomyces sp. NPDC059695]|uniref:hypothetical protein n=1 Tax=Streptomyces sp. NPDC059695 TaxID=3346910 RepID=UPI0036BB4DA0
MAIAQEVCRYYPLAAFAARDLTGRGERIEKGTMLLRDPCGQNRDPRGHRCPGEGVTAVVLSTLVR